MTDILDRMVNPKSVEDVNKMELGQTCMLGYIGIVACTRNEDDEMEFAHVGRNNIVFTYTGKKSEVLLNPDGFVDFILIKTDVLSYSGLTRRREYYEKRNLIENGMGEAA